MRRVSSISYADVVKGQTRERAQRTKVKSPIVDADEFERWYYAEVRRRRAEEKRRRNVKNLSRPLFNFF